MTPELRAYLARGPNVDHDEVVRLCNAALKGGSAKDPDVQTCKAVALLKLDRFDEALQLFEDAGSSFKRAAPLEYAYALYKSGELEKARDTAKGLDSRAARHLVAQAVNFISLLCSF